MIYCRKLTV